MTLSDHFDELRRCLLRATIGIAVGMTVCLFFGNWIMEAMCWPLAVALQARNMPVRLRALAPAESFATYLKVCLIWGAILAAPYSLWQIWKFVAVGLYPRERGYVHRMVPFSIGLFLAGVAFFFTVIAPICLIFFLDFGTNNFPAPPSGHALFNPKGDHAPAATAPADRVVLPRLEQDPDNPVEGQVWTRASDARIRVMVDGQVQFLVPQPGGFLSTELTLGYYITFVAWLSLVFGLGFQVPVVVLVLAGAGIVSVGRLASMRKYVVLTLLAIAAILTPPDVTSQIALAVPMYLLFELGLVLARASEKKRRRRAEQPAER